MNSSRTQTTISLALLAFLLGSGWLARSGFSAAPLRCTLDQQMWINGGGDGFGGLGVPGQTFLPSAPGTVCKVQIMIHKNDPAASDLQVVLRHSNFAPVLNGTATIPAAEIPMGLSVQTIDYCCNQLPVLVNSPFYGLTLASPNSVNPAAYTWINSDDAGADMTYLPGHGYYNLAGAAPGTKWGAAGYDYAFRIYMCR